MTDHDLTAVLQLAERLEPALERRDRAELLEIIGQLVALRAPMGSQWQQLAYLAANNGEIGLGRHAIDLYVETSAGRDAEYHKAIFLSQVGDLTSADALLRALPADVPSPVAHAFSRGTIALLLGESGEARGNLERVVAMQPKSGSTWLALSLAADLAREPELAERIVAAERGIADAIPSERAAYYHALGKALAGLGEPARAFAAFARGAELAKAAAGYDRKLDREGAAEAVRGYGAAAISAIAREQREQTGRTIFVTGLPRSGTTLVEQILTSHSAVGDGAETSRLELLTAEVGGASHDALASHVAGNGATPAARLWNHWLDQRFAATGRVVDKTVDNGRYLGLAAALLPEAPLIWVTRDPLDRAWSCFRTYFIWGGIPWSYDLADIAFHFRLEDQLLRRWQEILGHRLLVVPYETLVADPAASIRRILAHCGLDEEPEAFAPHENRRPIATASVMQVRRPINGDAVGVAEPYREFLAPFTDAYYG